MVANASEATKTIDALAPGQLVDTVMEQSLIGSLILEPSLIEQVRRLVGEAEFAHAGWGRLYGLMLEVYDELEGFDINTLVNRARNRDILALIGGVDRLVEAAESVPSAASGLYYAKTVRQYKKRRDLVELLQRSGALLREGVAWEVEDVAEQLRRGVDELMSRDNPDVVRLADVPAVKVPWLWAGKIAVGRLTMLAGDPGLGKSLLTLDIAARVTRGEDWPDGSACPAGSVILLSAEDDLGDTVRPRLEAAAADLQRVHCLTASVDLGRDLPAVRDALRSAGDAKLLIIDPISAYCGKTDSHLNAEVRAMLKPLGDLAAEAGVAVIAVTHLRKGEGRTLYRSMGSMAFVAAARSAWAVIRDPDNEADRLLMPLKNNLGKDTLAMRFRPMDLGGEVPGIGWDPEPMAIDPDTLDGSRTRRGGPGPTRSACATWLAEQLAAGPERFSVLARRAADEKLGSRATLNRAADELGVKRSRLLRDSLWTLP